MERLGKSVTLRCCFTRYHFKSHPENKGEAPDPGEEPGWTEVRRARSLFLSELSSGVAVRIHSDPPPNQGFPVPPDSNTKLMNINRCSFTEQKSPEIPHKY